MKAYLFGMGQSVVKLCFGGEGGEKGAMEKSFLRDGVGAAEDYFALETVAGTVLIHHGLLKDIC